MMTIVKRPRVYGYTLGCRLNSYETDALVEETVAATGGSPASGPLDADVIIVNTCAVTGRSQARSRKTVRNYLAVNTDAKLVITGCVSEVFPEDFEGLVPERVAVVPNSIKHRIPELLSGRESNIEGLFPESAPVNSTRTRAFLKIQDGCDNNCTYCIVPRARGSSRSQPRELILRQARELALNGYREICLTGVDIADYGKALYEGYGLPELVQDLLEQGGFRLRIGSVEPLYLSVKALEKMALQGVCRHFHIPFQSGSKKVLERMGRNYGPENERDLLRAIEQLFPGACVGSDIIAGFPGETESDFSRSRELAEDPAVSYLHVFPYSPRPGTPAAEMEQLHTETITARAEELRGISKQSRRVFREGMLGTEQTVLVEGRKVKGRNIGLTDNYIPVFAPEGSKEGEMVSVLLSRENVVWEQR